MRRGAFRPVAAAWLLLVWLAVTGSYTTASLVGGVVVVTLLMVLFRPLRPSRRVHRVRPVMLALYLWHFVYELVRANIEVAKAVIQPSRVEHTRGVLEIPLPRSSRLVAAILANAVSLTPGTSIIEVTEDPPSFHVHVLHVASIDTVRSSIAELHWRLVRALGPADRLDEVMRDAEELRRRAALDAERAGLGKARGAGPGSGGEPR